jgi:ketosteroid isomerase-like protein
VEDSMSTAESNVALMKRIWGPLERGESDDMQPFFDVLADDVVFALPVGEARGKDAVIGYFAHVGDAIEVQPFVKPLAYFGDGDRVVILGAEVFLVRETRLSHQADWAWVVDMRDGRVERITHIQDLSGIADVVRGALSKAAAAA